MIKDGESTLAPQASIGFGMVARTPMIQINTVGAGGGSIAYVDYGGLLEVGPDHYNTFRPHSSLNWKPSDPESMFQVEPISMMN